MDRLTLLATHALSSAIFGFALAQYDGIGAAVGALAGAVVFLCLRHVHDTMVRARDKRELTEDLDFIRAANASVREAHYESRKRTMNLNTALGRRMDAYEKKVAMELQRLDGLLNAGAVEAKATTEAEPETIPAAAIPFARPLADPAMLELIRRSLVENRVDLYLQPIVSLPQRKVRFYEALTRLRSADGSVIMPSQYIKVAAPAGLMSVVDYLLLFRCIQVVRRLTQTTRDIAVFCNISEHTLADPAFFPQFIEFLRGNRELSDHIVLEFAQEAVLQEDRAVVSGLKMLQELGFRLSLDQVTALDCDFAKLRAQGFRFVKVGARTLVSGMDQANAPVIAGDFKELLAGLGLDLIVERVEEEKTVVQLIEFDIGYGQGFLFGEPERFRDDAEINAPSTPDTRATSGFGLRRAG